MSGAHYIVGLPRSRSPSPVPVRRRPSQRGSVASDAAEDPEGERERGVSANAIAAAFGSDGKPRRGSFRRSVDVEAEEQHQKQKHLSPAMEDFDSGKPLSSSSSNEHLSMASTNSGGRASRKDDSFLRLQSSGFDLIAPATVSADGNNPEDNDVGATPVEVVVSTPLPKASRSLSLRERSLSLKEREMMQPSEFSESEPPRGEMSNLASGERRGYGSFNEVTVSINGDISPDNQASTNTGEFTPTQEQTPRPESREQRKFSSYTPSMVDELRKRNRLYFLDPITKLFYFHGFPWKLSLQILKVVIITIQIIIFGGQRQSIVEFFERSNLAFKHLLLQDWDIAYETMPYPPAAGQYAIYNIQALYDHMNYAMEQYHKLPHQSLAAVGLNRDPSDDLPYPVELCFMANDIHMFPNNSYIVRATVIKNCTYVYPDHGEEGNFTYDIEKFVEDTDFPMVINRTLDIYLKMYIRTFHLNLLETHYGPTCYNDSIKIVYKNNERSGQILINMESLPTEVQCSSQILSDEAIAEQDKVRFRMIGVDAVVIGICALSTILCARSLMRSNKLRKDTARYFKLQRNQSLSFSDHQEYINIWYVVIICNDVLTILGSAFKIQLEIRVFSISSANYELCSTLLGLGVLLTFVGILRYLGFFKSYNVLILTLKTSFPHVLRFLVCAICLYTGFLFCGWVMFSPYNLKFRKLSSTSECLFSLVNGDDMFVSFSALTNSSDAIWYLYRAYLYIFISLFIYVVISVFIAVIMDNYENLKNYYEGNRQDTLIQTFMKEDGEMPLKEVFSHVRRGGSCHEWFFCIFPCLACLRRRSSAADGYTLFPSTSHTKIKHMGARTGKGPNRPHSDDLTQDVF